MSTRTEDRLVAALAARADLVQPDHLSATGLPDVAAPATVHHLRRPAALLAVAAACAAVVTTVAVLQPDSADPQPAGPPAVDFTVVDEARGDLDGDGSADLVRFGEGGRVRVDLGSGTGFDEELGRGFAFLGLADLGASGLAIAGDLPDGDQGTVTSAWLVVGAGLVRASAPDGEYVGNSVDALSVAWVDDAGRLVTGQLASDDRRTNVYGTVRVIDDLGVLTAGEQDVWCWDRGTQDEPRPCAPGQSYGLDVGSADGLPTLFPESEGSIGSGESFDVADGSGDVVGLAPQGSGYRLTLTYGAAAQVLGATLPAGDPVAVDTTLLALGQAGSGIVVERESGDATAVSVYVGRGDGLVAAQAPSGTPFGNGFSADGDYHTWVSETGTLYTRQALATEGHYRVWSWQVTGPGEGGGSPDDLTPALVPTEVGEVCIDLTAVPVAFGTC
ncbi:MAG: hypothetical protein F2667_11245 [Actinobacteria bacterium]|uniref:Unannotated protein n=1 Tax=freshwater metagenome TaxID=449393 RepID=A0A6J6RJI8_9ZZZZ|nr:hypothetical protein [Actinomycetota bacterium]